MRKVGVPLLIFFTINCNNLSQDPILNNLRGTTIVLAEGTDGIIIATDSRLTEYSDIENWKVKYYIDSVNKIFNVKGCPIAISGLYTFGDKYVSDIISDFNNIAFINANGWNEVFPLFTSYMNRYYPIDKYPYAKECGFFSAGYRNDSAFLFLKWHDQNRIVRWDSCGASNVKADSILKTKYKKISTRELCKVAEEIIIEYHKKMNKIATGGEVSIIIITKDNNWLFYQNDFSSRTQKDFTKTYIIK